MEIEAVKVLKSIDVRNRNGKNFDEKKIQIIHRFKKNSPSLEDILLEENVKDLPILVFAVAGKTRGGKSFLLNLMIKHLEHLEKGFGHNWLSGSVPNCFKWKNGIDSVTRGLWILPKIFRLKDALDNEVGVLLLDAEGMYDGEATDGEVIAMSGISAAISYLQIFNLKEKITSDYLEGVVRSLIKGIEWDSDVTKYLRQDYRLMFVVRDWIGEDSFDFGSTGGQIYIDKESKKGTKEYHELWQMIHETFQDVKCVLLPDPGCEVRKRKFNESGDLQLLDEEFLSEVNKFVQDLFKPVNLKPPSTSLTGRDIFNILTSIDGKIADEELSFLSIYTEYGNSSKVEKWLDGFEQMLEKITFSGLLEAKQEMRVILQKAERALKGKSRDTYLTELKKGVEGALNEKVIEIEIQRYQSQFLEFAKVEKQHNAIWPGVHRELHEYLCGDNETLQNANFIFIKKSAGHYYGILHKEHERLFKTKCSDKEQLEELVGLVENEIKSFKECEDFCNDVVDKEAIYALWFKEYQCLKKEFVNILLEKISEITGISKDTLKILRQNQYERFESLTLLNEDWDEIALCDKILIAKKVGYAMFGLPSHLKAVISQNTEVSSSTSAASTPTQEGSSASSVVRSSLSANSSVITAYSAMVKSSVSVVSAYFKGKDNNEKTGYSKEQDLKIWPIVDKIISLSSVKVKFACFFLNYSKDNDVVNVPLFKVKTNETVKFIDSNCRLYSEWEDFLISNTLNDIVFCYPLNGGYSKKEGFGIAFSNTPASKTIRKALKVTDTIGKIVTVGGGAAAIAVVAGITAPIVLPVAIVASGISGAYGAVRGVQKMMDKKEHGESIKVKDVANLAGNILAVVGAAGMAVGRFAAIAAEGAVILGSRIAAGLTGLTSLTVLFTDTNDTLDLISLIAQVEESSLKMLFYFNASSLESAVHIIRKSLKLENSKSTDEVLMALVENNCIQFCAETGSGEVKVEKYISHNTFSLVTSILTAVGSDVRDIVLHYCNVHCIFNEILNELIRRNLLSYEQVPNYVEEHLQNEEIPKIMTMLFEKLEHEILVSKTRITNAVCQNIDLLSDNPTFIESCLDKLEGKEGIHLILAFRHLTCSIISGIRKANNFFNSIDHKAVTLEDHYLGGVSCHPIHEITQRIKEMVEQSESAMDLHTIDLFELNYFILEVLKRLEQYCNETSSSHEFARCLIKISKDIVSQCENIVCKHKEIVEGKQEELSCNDLHLLFEEIGLEGYNYGMLVMNKVFSEYKADTGATEVLDASQQGAGNLVIMPAWNGILDHLYYYYSKEPVNEKLELIYQIERIPDHNYREIKLLKGFLSLFIPCIEDLPSFVVVSEVIDKNERGFIWLFKNDKQET